MEETKNGMSKQNNGLRGVVRVVGREMVRMKGRFIGIGETQNGMSKQKNGSIKRSETSCGQRPGKWAGR